MNEFKISALRQFGSENISFTATIHSESQTLTPEEVQAQIDQYDLVIRTGFAAVCKREIDEKVILKDQSVQRQKANEELNAQLESEVASANKMKASGTKLEKLITKNG